MNAPVQTPTSGTPSRRGAAQEGDIVGVQPLDLVDQPADHDDVVEARRVAQPLVGLDDDARARLDRVHRRREHPPAAEDRPRAVALVGGEPQHVHEVREGAEGEAPGQDKADAEPGRGWSIQATSLPINMPMTQAYSELDAIHTVKNRRDPAYGSSSPAATGRSPPMTHFSAMSVLRNALTGNRELAQQWPDAEPKREYDVIIVGAGGHGLGTAYYLAKEHGITNVAVIEKGWLGGGNTGRNTTIIRSNYLYDESARLYDHALDLWEGLSQELNYNVMFSKRGVHDAGAQRP